MRRLWVIYCGETKMGVFQSEDSARVCLPDLGGEIVEMVEAAIAPELLACLKEARFRVAGDCQAVGDMIAEWDAAIAKAEGL